MRYRSIGVALVCGTVLFAGAAEAADLIPLKLASTSKEVFDNLELFVAQDAGFFKKEGLKVDISYFRGGGEVVRAVSAGTADVAQAATSATIIAIKRGEPLRVFSSYTAPAYALVWLVDPKSSIKQVSDLAGKKVGISRPGSVTHTGLTAALKANKLEGKVTIVPVGSPGSSLGALKSGRVDASWGAAPSVYEVVGKGEARILFQISDYLKDYQQGSLVATTDTIKKKADALKRLMKALDGAKAYIDSNRKDTVRICVANMEVSADACEKTLDNMPKRFFHTGAPEKSDMAGSIQEAVEVGKLAQSPTYADVVDTSLLK